MKKEKNNRQDKKKTKVKKNGAATYIISSAFLLAALLLLVFAFMPELSKVVSAATPSVSHISSPPSHTVTSPTPSRTTKPTASPSKAPSPSPTSSPTEDPNAKYFTSQEKVTINPDKTEWTYESPELYIDIRKYDKNNLELHYFVADIRTKGNEIFKSGFSDEAHPGKNALLPYLVAKKLKSVFLLNGDYFEDPRNPSGVVIRHGVMYRDEKNADTLAIMPDGNLKIYSGGEINAEGLLKLGVRDTFSFGPELIKDGVINPNLSKARLERENPRTGVGMVDKGHYIAIVVEGRNPEDNRGITLPDYAKMFADLGCTAAYNLDGGASTAMVFMGETLNVPTDILTSKTWRRVPDVITIGTSDSVPAYK